jgi:hypothetical protein
MPLSDDVKHVALAPLEALWAGHAPGNDEVPSIELAHAAIAAAHEGILAALVLIATAVEQLDASAAA